MSFVQQVAQAIHFIADGNDLLAIRGLQGVAATQVLGSPAPVFLGHLAVLEHAEEAAVLNRDGLRRRQPSSVICMCGASVAGSTPASLRWSRPAMPNRLTSNDYWAFTRNWFISA